MSSPIAERVELAHLCDIDVDLDPPLAVATATGTRLTYITRGGAVHGERLAGAILPGGGDWLVLGTDGVGRLDVRAMMRLDDGELVNFTVTGVAALSDEAKARLAAGEHLDAGEMHVRTQLRFDADPDGPRAWLNAITTIGVNELGPGHVGYRVFEVL